MCCNGWFLGVELKAQNGRPEELQLYNLREISKAGGIGILLYPRDFEQFAELIELLSNGAFPGNNRAAEIINYFDDFRESFECGYKA